MLKNMSEKFNSKTSLANINLSLKINSSDDIINNFINVDVETDDLSSSASKELLFMLISLLNESEKETHIIIDDFDSFLDEETTIHLFKEFEKIDGFIYLFTNKPNSILYSIGRYGIFNIRQSNFYDFSNILFLLKKSLENEQFENQTYEEYMINFGYFENSGLLNEQFKNIKNNSIYNLGRILTSKDFKITNTVNYDTISIIPSSENEKSFLNYINYLINNN